ncbi:hypothetical protein P4O66_021443, partial [Electrophorus voltai]
MVGCYVFGCNHRTGGIAGCSFRRFPAKETKRRLWARLLRRPDRKPNPNSRVCSCHFPLGKNIPTILLPGGRLCQPEEETALSPNVLAVGKMALPPNPQENREIALPQYHQEAELADGQIVVSTSEGVEKNGCGKSAKMDKENSFGTCSPVYMEKDGIDARVPEAAHVIGEPEVTDLKPSSLADFKSLTVSSKNGGCYLQCPLCYYQCNTKSSFQIHIGSRHPLHCEDMAVGRLGKIIFYQRTAKLFHCQSCFFTSKDYNKLFDHLLVKHCITRKVAAADEAKRIKPKSDEAKDGCGSSKSGKDLTEVGNGESGVQGKAPSCSEEEEEEEDLLAVSQAAKEERDAAVAKYMEQLSPRYYYCKLCKWRCKKKGFLLNHVSQKHKVRKLHACKDCSKTFMLEIMLIRHVNLCHKQGLYKCLYCPFKSNFLRGLRRHLNRCRIEDDN